MKNIIIALVALLIVGAVAVWAVPHPASQPTVPTAPAEPPAGSVSTVLTVTGTFACLPHKGSGPYTMECAYGMKGNDGAYYALDWSALPTSAFDLPMDKPYSVTGLFSPAETLNSDHWKSYEIKGVIKVSSYKALTDMPAMPLGSATLELRTPVKFGDTVIRILAVTEDSRCPSDVTCIQAGRVKVSLTLESPSGVSKTAEIQQGETATTATLAFTLDKVTPYPISTHKTSDSEYRFMFTVRSR